LVAVGPATAERLVDRGLHPDLIPEDHRAEGVVDAIVDEGIGPGTTVLLPRALDAREVLPERLAEAGAKVDVVPVYRNVIGAGDAAVLERLEAGTVDAVTFTSSSTARNFVRLLEEAQALDALKDVLVASIGPVTSETAKELGLHVGVEPGEYTVPSLVRALDKAF
jgi:uroporphyrinogen III methyltransferase/synthase